MPGLLEHYKGAQKNAKILCFVFCCCCFFVSFYDNSEIKASLLTLHLIHFFSSRADKQRSRRHSFFFFFIFEGFFHLHKNIMWIPWYANVSYFTLQHLKPNAKNRLSTFFFNSQEKVDFIPLIYKNDTVYRSDVIPQVNQIF